MKRAARTDGNHKEIVDVLRAHGASVLHLHMVGKGCPDIVVGFRGHTYLVEIKNGSVLGWKLTDDQKKFHVEWKAPVVILDSVDTTLCWLRQLSRSNRSGKPCQLGACPRRTQGMVRI